MTLLTNLKEVVEFPGQIPRKACLSILANLLLRTIISGPVTMTSMNFDLTTPLTELFVNRSRQERPKPSAKLLTDRNLFSWHQKEHEQFQILIDVCLVFVKGNVLIFFCRIFQLMYIRIN